MAERTLEENNGIEELQQQLETINSLLAIKHTINKEIKAKNTIQQTYKSKSRTQNKQSKTNVKCSQISL